MLSGFPANSVFIVDSKDRVRHHTVLDPRLINFHDVEYDDFVGVGGDVVNPRAGWNMEEVARLVAAFRFPPYFNSSHIYRVQAGTDIIMIQT